ncbi:MAG: hydantoin utilization protein B [Syntrophobacteraceae bacterium CG2_30_61_12]|nr:MAG: hydantoin utilization protein B [Syntrophobacteraceae bacterium CG2_30_61_12]
MCLAIPAEIVELDQEMATVRVGDALRRASLALLPGPANLGDYVIVHAGFALHKVNPEEALKSLELLRELAAYAVEEDPAAD